MTLNISKVSRDEVPKLAVPGRTREPSDFDDVIGEAYADGEWRAVPFSDQDELSHLWKELGRAVTFYNANLDEDESRVGTSKRVDGEESGTFYFRVRNKLATGRRGPRTTEDGTVEDDGDDEDVAEEVPTGNGRRRGRKAEDVPA